MQVNKNILRIILVCSYICIIAFILFGIGSTYSYLNTGANRESILHTHVKKETPYIPKTTWDTINLEGRSIDLQTLKRIKKDYLNAWYIKHLANKTNNTYGINDYYTKHARKNIIKTIKHQQKQNIYIDETTLEHHINIDFFSEDGQLAVLTDRDVIDYKHIYQNNKIILKTQSKATYKVILLLEDGFWRIRHLIKEKQTSHNPTYLPALNTIKSIKGINYYPQSSPWDMFGDTFNKSIIEKDFKIIKNAGLNSIRIFIPYQDFGAAHVKQEKLNKLKQILDIAKAENLGIVITLFDFYGDYSITNWTLNRQHASSIVSAIKNHDALLAWDIKNEPNLDFKSRNKETVLAWLENMVFLIKSLDNKHPVTIGWSNVLSAKLLSNKVDFVSFHYYDDINLLEQKYKSIKKEITNKPIVLTEFGMSTYKGFWNPFGNSEKDQKLYYKKAQEVFNKNSINFMSWTLYDYYKIPKEVVGRLPWKKQTQGKYGLINHNRETKPAFKYISSM